MTDSSDRSERARALLSSDAIPKIEVPKSERHERREFKLPDEIQDPVPSRTETKAPRRQRRPSSTKFRERTLSWFKTGDEEAERETQEVEPFADGTSRRRNPTAVVAVVFIAVVIAAVIGLSLFGH